MAEYLFGLAQRAPQYVDWSVVPEPFKAAASPLANKGDDLWKAEEFDLTKAVIDAITMLTTTGAQAGELASGIYIGVSSRSQTVLVAAREQVATLVSQVTETNRKLIREAIKQSIARGEDVAATIERIKAVVNNPVRAEMIAQTESVNAYGCGGYDFSVETGAKTKTLEALADACKSCGPSDGQTVDIDKPFVLTNGHEFMFPACHVRGRCGVYYQY
nr:phage minor head protein [Rhodococcus qingshengii]